MEFGARATGASFAHHPEVILFVSVDDMDGGIEANGTKFFCPKTPSFFIAFGRIADGFIWVVNGCVDTIWGEVPAFDD